LGISSLYLKWGNSKSTLTSLEGCPEVAAKARHHFKLLDQEDIAVYTGDFSTTLPHYLSSIKELDLVFFDGNHQLKPTLDYFYACLEKAHDGTVFIFDDIHWSPGMLAAWEEIKNNKRVTVSLDLYFMGLVFFRNGQEKQHFNLRY
jgi:predicted O-methyltransferase YrrM